MIKLTDINLNFKWFFLLLVITVLGVFHPNLVNAADQKDKSARRAQLMMQKIKQDMELEKSNLQAQFEVEKKALEEKIKVSEAAKLETEKKLSLSEKRNQGLESNLKKTNAEKTALEATLQKTKTDLDTTQNNLTVLKGQFLQAEADLKFNDNQRKTIASNLAKTTKSVNECEAKNAQLHQFGTELIQLYETPSKYEAAMRKESFFQLKRVELENILQNKQNSLDEARFSNQKAGF